MDVLSTLQECSWRGISFPVVAIGEDGSQDMPMHKAADRDGAFVEGTGRNPFVYSISGVFLAGTIARGRNETWDDLYPGTFLRVRDAYMDRTTGDLVHPLYGAIRCKPMTWKTTLASGTRAGQFVEMQFVETRDDGVTPAFSTSERAFARTTAADLDSQLAALVPSPSVFGPGDDASSFLDAVSQLTRIVDGATIQASQALAKVDRVIAKLDRLSDSIDRGVSVVTVEPLTRATTNLGRLGPGSGRIWTNTRALRSALVDVRNRIGGSKFAAEIRTYVTPGPVMLVVLASRLGCEIKDLLTLNPQITRSRPTIPANTLIRYFSAA